MLELLVQQALEQHHERVREAEKLIAMNEALADRSHGWELQDRAAERLGGWLVTWGKQLQGSTQRRRGHYI